MSSSVTIDVEGRAVLPGWVDSHTHLVFAGDRTAEFAARSAGARYTASGIMDTVTATREASDAALAATLRRHLAAAMAQGTTCVETKTGYGLTVADEQRSAWIAAEVVDEVTFLGAHLVPPDVPAADYLRLVTGEMLDAVAPHVSWVDVFCDRGAFDADAAAQVLAAGRARGLGLRMHGNQLGPGRGWPSSTGRPAWTTAPTCRRPMWTRWQRRRRWPRCCRRATCPAVPRCPMRARCWTRA